MPDVHFTYRDNIFNDYVGRRVRVIVRTRKKKSLVFIGTFKAFDYHVNVVLADVVRVILFCQEEQAQAIDGLMLIRGVHVRCITFEDTKLSLPPWPTRPITSRSRRAMKSKAAVMKKENEEKEISKLSTPTKPSKPLKLKRTWLTTSISSTPIKSTSSQENPGSPTEQKNVSVKQEVPDDDAIPVKVKEEVKEEILVYGEGESLLKSFKNFLVTHYDYDDLENENSEGGEISIKQQPDSPSSDMSTAS